MKVRTKGIQAALFYALGKEKKLKLSKSNQEYGRIAADALMKAIRKNNRRTSPDDLAVLYDWAYSALSHTERLAFVNFCKLRLGNKIRIHNGKQHGYRCSPRPLGLIAALAFYNDGIDDSYAKKLLVQGIRDTLIDNLAMEHVAGSDGGFADGTSYIISLGGTFKPFLALGIATDTDFFFQHEVLTRLPKHLMYAMLPFPIQRVGDKRTVPYFATFHDNFTATTKQYGSAGNMLAARLAITAAEYRRHGDTRTAGLYMWFLQRAFGGIPRQGENPLSIVLMDWNINPQNPEELNLPLAEALGWNKEKGEIDRDRFGKKAGIGWVGMRSAWDDPDATFAIFKAEPFYYHGHMHHDSLAFMITKGEELALARAGNYMCWYEGGPLNSNNPGWPQMMNFFSRTISTNNLLIYNPEEKFKGWTNDGGQRFTAYWDAKWGRTYNGTANENYRDIGGLIHFKQSDNFVYAVADATRAYNSTKVTSGKNHAKVNLVQREFVYLRSPQGHQDYFVIFDRIKTTNPDFKTFWLLQLRAKPEFNGTYQIMLGDELGGVHSSEDTSAIHVQQERAALFCNSLLPKDGNRIVRRLGGWITTRLKKPLEADDNGPLDISIESTEGLPDHPVVIITNQPPNPAREVFDRFSIWPQSIPADTRPVGQRVCYFCEGKTPPDQKPGKLLNCIRATRSAPGFAMPAGSRVIQEFRHMGIEDADKGKVSGRLNYPWGYGLGYNYGDGNQYGLWRLEISPKKDSRSHLFLNVLHPTLRPSGMMKAKLIESEDESLYGAYVNNKVVLFASGSDTLEKGGYTFSGNGNVWQLLCNLKPEKRYQIEQDGKPIIELISSKQGIVAFESEVSGSSHFQFNIVDP
ncbi:MAG: hypothetical protein J7L69_05985 [Desulfobulbaceae bacterium]|nr:hypothetical protein [Desulfobulbaceae bacterium]